MGKLHETMVHKMLDIKQQRRVTPKWWERSPGRASGLPGLRTQSWECSESTELAFGGQALEMGGLHRESRPWGEPSLSWVFSWAWISICWAWISICLGGNYSGLAKNQGCLLYQHPFKHPFQKNMLPLPLRARHVEKGECQIELSPNISHPSFSYHSGIWWIFQGCK